MYKLHLVVILVFLCISKKNIKAQEYLYAKSIDLPFSHPDKEDEFSIQIFGKSISKGEVLITIIAYDGQTLFEEKYPSNYLIGYGLALDETDSNKIETYIKKRVDEFFNEDKFFTPAIAPNDQFDPDYSSFEIWNDIKSDSTAIGFYYLIGEEAGCRIAFSKKHQKVVKYFCCC